MIARIRALFVVLVLVASTPILGGIVIGAALLGVRDRPGSIFDRVARAWGRVHLWAGGVRVVEHGTEHKEGAQHVFVANHLGMFDVFALAASLPWIKIVAKAELFRIPLFGRAIRAAGMIPIERASAKASFGAYSVATQAIQRGASVAVYPEGTRGTAYALRPFKRGPFVLAIQAQAPVVPVAIHGALDISRKGEFGVRPGTIHLHYLPAIPTTGLTFADRGEVARRAYEAMAHCLRETYGVDSPPYRAG
jgi:1-acyl-sn-glycerol-3-phosphate acyltransferase